MSSANVVATLGPHPSTFLGRATSAVYRQNITEAEMRAENFVLASFSDIIGAKSTDFDIVASL